MSSNNTNSIKNIHKLSIAPMMDCTDKHFRMIMRKISSEALLYTEMDYKKEKFSSQFIFKNPNETERCGCGESFKV